MPKTTHPFRLTLRGLVASFVWLLVVAGNAHSVEQYVEGTHYKALPIPVATDAEDGVEVVEVFSYGCIHCYTFDPMVEAWSKSRAGIEFRRTPAIFNQSWALLAQAFYTAEALGVSDRMHLPLFRAIHDEPINLGDKDIMARLFRTAAGVAPDAFNQAWDSFAVSTKVSQASGQGRAYRLRAVPSMVVDGSYLIDSSMVPGGNAEMLKVVDFLIDKVAAERQQTASSD